ncbi:MAG: alginate lyase family protein [Saprospiraceae bacterium]|nr:alginate lyase family protein [Saprospiraceae bacterium]
MEKTIKMLAASICLLVCLSCSNRHDNGIDNLWQEHPQRLRQLLDAIDLNQEGLSQVRNALVRHDTIAAFRTLIEYFEGLDRSWVIEALDSLSYQDALPVAECFLADSVMVGGVRARIPLRPEGGWTWSYLGPNVDAEFAYSLNSQSYLPALHRIWLETGNAGFIHLFNDIIFDWATQHPLPAENDSIYLVLNKIDNLDYRDIGEVEWRTLDTGRRLGASWPQLFYAFIREPGFLAETKLIMLASFFEQAEYLLKYHKSGHNWTTMEMNGLALTGLAFPEFNQSEKWLSYALETMTKEINRQVYPDGVQVEISTKTQWVALRRFESLANNFKRAGRKIEPAYFQRIEAMYNYLAYCMRPDGHQPLNNDSDREDLRERVLLAADKFNRTDWIYIATNGKKGSKPDTGPSVSFPWAGINIMRSGWDADADWTFFDQGPYGTGHQHRDMLHLSISAFGHDLLVDGGRYTHRDYFSFDPKTWRGYFRSSFSHNVILIDNAGQNAGPLTASQPLVAGLDYLNRDLHDFATGTFSHGFTGIDDEIVHRRSIVYIKNHQWLVVDNLEMNKPHQISVLWHFAPQCELTLSDNQALTKNSDRPNLMILPLGDLEWDVKIVSGQEAPEIQGWYSADYDERQANPTAIYQSQVAGTPTFAWLIIASTEQVPPISASHSMSNKTMDIVYELEGQTRHLEFPMSHLATDVKVK